MNAREYIDYYKMERLPEGGWYALIHRSDVSLPPELTSLDGERASVSAIYYLLEKGDVSVWHKLCSQETYFYLDGGTYQLELGGTGARPEREGTVKVLNRSIGHFHHLVPKETWQMGTVIEGDFALVVCIVSPSFDDRDILFEGEDHDSI